MLFGFNRAGYRLALPVFCALLSFNVQCEDVVRLGNGDVFSGKLISYLDGVCVFETRYGATVRLPTKDVAALATDDIYQVTLNSDEKVTGQLANERGSTVLRSGTFGTVGIEMRNVGSLVRAFPKTASAAPASEGKIGEESSKQAPLTFLTGSTVLLAPGQYELDLGVAYKQNRDASSLPGVGYFQMAAFSARQATFDATLRGGLSDGIEGWISVPYTYSSVEEVSSNQYVRDKSNWHAGDVSFGLQYQLRSEDAKAPAVSATLGVSVPTGQMRYRAPENTWQDPLNSGSGHWIVSPGVAFVRSADPAILFGGASVSYAFARNIDGYNVKPGWLSAFYFGVGYALNENLSLGTRFSYAYSSRMEVDGEKIYGSDKDPMNITMSASYRFADKWTATPMVTFNLNHDGGAPSLALRMKRSLD